MELNNLDNVDFTNGLKIVEIPRFERLNPTLSINVFENNTDEDNGFKLVPLFISKHK